MRTPERAAREAIDFASRAGSLVVGDGHRPSAAEPCLHPDAAAGSRRWNRRAGLYTMFLDLHGRDLAHPKVMESALCDSTGRRSTRWAISKPHSTSTAVHWPGRPRCLVKDSRLVGESLSAMVPLEIEIGALRSAVEHARRAIAIYLKEGQPDLPLTLAE